MNKNTCCCSRSYRIPTQLGILFGKNMELLSIKRLSTWEATEEIITDCVYKMWESDTDDMEDGKPYVKNPAKGYRQNQHTKSKAERSFLYSKIKKNFGDRYDSD